MRTLIHMPTATAIELDYNKDMRIAFDNGETLAIVTDGIENYILTESFAYRMCKYNSNWNMINTQNYEFVLEETL